MNMAVTAQLEGRAEKVNTEASAKWLRADCGSMKPMAQQK